MVSRKSRNYREKKSIRTFGQLILPLAIIMLFALFFVSVKLFFMDPNDVYLGGSDKHIIVSEQTDEDDKKEFSEPELSAVQNDQVKREEESTSEVIAEKKSEVIQETIPKAQSPKPKTVVTKAQTAPAKKPTQVSSPVTKPASSATSRWDVQIGGFRGKESALALHEKAKNQGYTVYLNDSIKDGQPFYRVRIKGHSSKEETARLAAKIQGEGYPIYLVSVK